MSLPKLARAGVAQSVWTPMAMATAGLAEWPSASRKAIWNLAREVAVMAYL